MSYLNITTIALRRAQLPRDPANNRLNKTEGSMAVNRKIETTIDPYIDGSIDRWIYRSIDPMNNIAYYIYTIYIYID